MIKQIANLGVMSMLGTPMLFKLVPKRALGGVVKKIAQHYLRTGHHLQEAMREASEATFTALDMGLRPSLFRKMTRSKASKEFVEQFQLVYLEKFLQENEGIDRDAFCKASSKACRKILKQLDELIEPISPAEEDVHGFFSQGAVQNMEDRMNTGEMKLLKKLNELEEVTPPFLALLRFEHLLFQGLHYFFRQEIAKRPEVKAMFDEMSDLRLLRSAETAKQQRDQMQVQLLQLQENLSELTEELKSAKGDKREKLLARQAAWQGDEEEMEEQLALLRDDLIAQAQAQWDQTQTHLQGFERRLGASLDEAREDIRQARDHIIYEIMKVDHHLDRQDRVLDEIRMLLYDLMRRGSSESEYVMAASSMVHSTFHGNPSGQWKPLVREAATGAGLSNQEVEKILKGASSPSAVQRLKERTKAPHALLEVMGTGGRESRTFFVYLSPQLQVGRHSRNDMVLYWYPLPEPPEQTNPEWRNWQGSGECHPTLNISGTHLDLQWTGAGLRLRDHSSKGTFVNRERIRKGELIDVPEGALISAADVVTLSYSLLRDEHGHAVGWRLRRMNNAPGREEYLYIDSGATVRLGASSLDAIAFSAPGVRASHLQLKREGDRLLLLPAKHEVLLNNQPLEAPHTLDSGVRVQLGEQVIWCFPP